MDVPGTRGSPRGLFDIVKRVLTLGRSGEAETLSSCAPALRSVEVFEGEWRVQRCDDRKIVGS
jgi:hypothetical protein